MTDWTSDANQALSISLVRSLEDEKALADDESYSNFHPRFTYPIFGEDEKIYGYKDLTINLKIASGSLVQHLSVNYSSKLDSASTVDDVEGILNKFIPPDYYKDEESFLRRVGEDATSFQPSGQMIYSYSRPSPISRRKDKSIVKSSPIYSESDDVITFEVYHATWHTPGFKEYHQRMQLFILLYIEAGSYINEEEEPWEFVVLYEKRKRRETPHVATYHFVGYSSLFNFYCFPDKVRMRLSSSFFRPTKDRVMDVRHCIHLPTPNLGAKPRPLPEAELYRAIYQYVLTRPGVAELTVEDPAEAFEDLRDRNDLKMLLGNDRFMAEAFGESAVSHGGGRVGRRTGRSKNQSKGKMGPPVDKVWMEKWRIDLKIAGRQFNRLVEMLVLLRLDPADSRAARAYRLQVKERLYRFNYEILIQLEQQERLEKLEETFHTVREDYLRILSMIR